MGHERVTPIVLAVAGFVAVVIGVHQGLMHVAPGYEGTITTGWGGGLNHEERLLVGIGAVGLGGTVAARRWKRLAVVPVVIGGTVLFYAVRAVLWQVRNTRLYTEVTTYSGDPVVFVLGAEPFLLVTGGLFLVGAGIVSWRRRTNQEARQAIDYPSTSHEQ
jgi:hypothetical protein